MRLAAIVAGAMALSVWAGEQDADALIKELSGEAEAVKRTAAEWEAAHAKALDALLPQLGSQKPDVRGESQRLYEKICWRASRPSAEAERAAAVKAILSRLRPETPKAALIALLERLEDIGREESVAAIAKLLDAKEGELPSLREHARRALVTNPSPKAVDALRAALGRADSAEWRVALANALGQRRDKAAVPALIKLVKDDSQGVKLAAVEALARIGDKGAASLIAGVSKGAPPRVWRTAIASYLLLADRLVEDGDKAAALKLYQNLLEAEGHVRSAALIGVGRAGGVAELAAIFEALASNDSESRSAATMALGLLPAETVRAAATEKLKTASPELKVVLIRLLTAKGDKGVLPLLMSSAGDPAEGVRIAAYEGLATLGDESAMPTLLAALAKAQGKELEAARSAAARIPGHAATSAIVKALAGGETPFRLEVIRTLAARKDEAAIPALLAAAEDKEDAIRGEALRALAAFAGEKALPGLVGLLLKASHKDRPAAERAVVAAAGRVEDEAKRADAVLAALPKADVPARGALLRILGRLGGRAALEAVRSALKDANAEVREAALRALADWPDASVAADLLALAKAAESLPHHVLALRGLLRILALPTAPAVEERLRLLGEAMAAARRPEEKKEVLGAFGAIASPEALRQAEKFLADEALRAEAAAAAVKIAGSLIGSQPDAAKAALKKLLDSPLTDDLKRQAQDALAQIEKFEDYITAWEVSGPYTRSGKDGPALHDIPFPPEAHLAQPPAAVDKGVTWELIPPGGGEKQFLPFHMDLIKKLGQRDNAAAYLRTNLWSPEDQKARLEFGSDDGAKVWLNQALVLNVNQPRSFQPGKDVVEVALKKGWNPLLVKVWNGTGHWGMAARLRRPDGSRLDGLRAALKTE